MAVSGNQHQLINRNTMAGPLFRLAVGFLFGVCLSLSSALAAVNLVQTSTGVTDGGLSVSATYPATPTQGNLKLSELEAQQIIAALERNNYRRLKTAKELGISKTTLWRKIKQYEIKIP